MIINKKIINYIKENPYITRNELAKRMNITTDSVINKRGYY